MDQAELAAAADPDALGRYLAGLPEPHHTHSPRQDLHRGHRILIDTHYEITVDGRPLHTHITVDNDGELHCHAVPAYQFLSAVEMVRMLIDTYPDDFPPHHAED